MPAHPIVLQGLHKRFGARSVLNGVSLRLQAKRLSVIVGRSGSGKSTLLRCLNGLERPDAGTIHLHGRAGMVFQQFHLFPHMKILENLMLAPRVAWKRQDTLALQGECLALLEKVGLSTHAQHYPSQLSGGQQQRAAIARALACQPEVLLYDEPTSSLDPHLAEEVLQVMASLRKEGLTQVLVTHELDFAKKYADHVVFLEDGVVVEEGDPKQLFGHPKDPRTKLYLGGAA